MLQHAAGSTMPSLNQGTIERIPVVVPPLPIQKAIAHILGSLDDRIELCRRMNETLEAMARALFKDWFIDFGPVRAKMEGREPPGLSPEIAALFPSNLVNSELGEIPEGWSVNSIESLCSAMMNGGTPSRSNSIFWDGGSIPWVKTGELRDGFLLSSSEAITQAAVENTSVKILAAGSILMAIYAAPTVGRLGILTQNSAFNQACTGMTAKKEVGAWFLYLSLYFGRDWFNNRANGAAQQNISKQIVASYTTTIPSNSLLEIFHLKTDAIFEKIKKNTILSDELSTLRDTLLPKLLSGELHLPAAMLQVEAVP